MPRDRYRDPDDEPTDWEIPSESDDEGEDFSADDDGSVIRCPYCGEDFYEDAELCPHCKSYVSQEDEPAPRRSVDRFPRWLALAIVLALVAVFSGLFAVL